MLIEEVTRSAHSKNSRRANRPDTLAVVLRASSRAVQALPPPDGYGEWTQDAVGEEVSLHFQQRPYLLTKALTAGRAAGVDSDEKLEPYLRTTAVNAMKDQARRTQQFTRFRRRLGQYAGDPLRVLDPSICSDTCCGQ
jgi:hypothetical protein